MSGPEDGGPLIKVDQSVVSVPFDLGDILAGVIELIEKVWFGIKGVFGIGGAKYRSIGEVVNHTTPFLVMFFAYEVFDTTGYIRQRLCVYVFPLF